ncbi:leucine-rich repeat domain-containing protein [Leptospira sp. 96542]|nr:leucine-rich repeat domain-containing protein [Leptospira sp. 96542]
MKFIITITLFGFCITNCAKETLNFEDWVQMNQNETVLNLSKKEVVNLPVSIQKLTKVEELTLQYDSIQRLPDEIGELKTLRILNLYGNPITSLPSSMGNLSNLEILLLGRTKLTSVPTLLPKLTKLRTLAFDETDIQLTENDVDILAEMKSLEILDLTLLRKFESLPKNFGKLSNLKEISFQKTLLEREEVARLRDELPKVRIKL